MNNILVFDDHLNLTILGNAPSINETERLIKGYRIQMNLTHNLSYRLIKLSEMDHWSAYSIYKDQKCHRIILVHSVGIAISQIPLSHYLNYLR